MLNQGEKFVLVMGGGGGVRVRSERCICVDMFSSGEGARAFCWNFEGISGRMIRRSFSPRTNTAMMRSYQRDRGE